MINTETVMAKELTNLIMRSLPVTFPPQVGGHVEHRMEVDEIGETEIPAVQWVMGKPA